MRTFLIVMIFFVVGALVIISNHNLTVNNKENFLSFSEMYIDWMNKVYVNSLVVSGNIVKLDWFPNSSKDST